MVQTFSILLYLTYKLLAKINVKLNAIGITETRLKKSSIRNKNIDLNGYSFEHTMMRQNAEVQFFI